MSDASGLTVFIVDDDRAVRDSLALLLSLRGFRAATFASAEDFMSAWQPEWRGCLVADLRMPGMDGLALQSRLAARGSMLPFVVITAHGDVASARSAFRANAVDFLEKPFGDEAVIAAVEAAFERQRDRAASEDRAAERERRMQRLTPREREIATLLVEGLHNVDVAARLGISARTVEVHKARIMEKLGAGNLAELIRLVHGA